MLFNSYEFLLLFFPTTIAAYLLFGRNSRARAFILLTASLVFYGNWSARYLLLLLASIGANYGLGLTLQRAVAAGSSRRADLLLGLGVALNLGVLGVFKYATFIVDNVNALAGTELVFSRILLPLGISFFTFEQIGFLTDLRRGAAYRLDWLRYGVFVAFFPRLVAGPILRYNELVPQLESDAPPAAARSDLEIGLSIFAIGLAKKAFFADGIAPFVASSFSAAATGQHLDFFRAWSGALAYTCQLYFDFSGYSDMAVGAARCFGIRFPENFNSPYKSRSIIEFWRRWHMTLSRFLRDYLYISLGGNRRGTGRRYVNLLVTMLLGGLWHGANWTFFLWGALHGSFLMVNHAWEALARRSDTLTGIGASRFGRAASWVLTFFAVVVAWVFFRAPSIGAGFEMLAAMAGRHGAELPPAISWNLPILAPLCAALGIRSGGAGAEFLYGWLWIVGLLAIALLAPNRQEIVAEIARSFEEPAGGRRRLSKSGWAIAAGFAAFLGFISVTRTTAFLYWQF